MDIISRAEWGARPPRSINTTTWSRRTEFIVHYSGASASQSVRSIQNYCMDTKGFSDIDYNALVDMQGRIYEGRTGIWLTVGSHCLNHNTAGIGVCLVGDESTPITPAVKSAIRWLCDEANRLRRAAGVVGALSIHPHSDFVQTSCPGDQLRAWVRAGMPAAPGGDITMFCSQGDKSDAVKAMQLQLLQLDPNCLPRFGPDGDFGGETQSALSRLVTGGEPTYYGPDAWALMQQLIAARFGTGKGEKGDPGPAGPQGEPGAAAVLAPGAALRVVSA